jgi:hypothetical protein
MPNLNNFLKSFDCGMASSMTTIFSVPPECQTVQSPVVPLVVSECDLSQISEQLESLVLSKCNDLLTLCPSAFTHAVRLNMHGPHPLSPDAQGHLVDWILSQSQTTPEYLAACSFLNLGVLNVYQIKDLLHLVASSPDVVPGCYRAVVDGLLSLKGAVDQMRHDMDRMIDKVSNSNVNPNITDATSLTALQNATQTQEQAVSRAAGELQAAVNEVNERAEVVLAAVNDTMAAVSEIRNLIGQVEAAIDSKRVMGSISCLRRCRNVLDTCKGRWDVKSSPQYCVDRLARVLLEKDTTDQVIASNPSTWNGWFSDPLFMNESVVTITFQKGICVVIDRYVLGSGILGVSRSGYLRSWELHGRICGKWEVLDKQLPCSILSDCEPHQFSIETGRCAVEAIRLCQRGRNRLGTYQMHLTAFVLSGDIIGPPGMFEIDGALAEEEQEEEIDLSGIVSGGRKSNSESSCIETETSNQNEMESREAESQDQNSYEISQDNNNADHAESSGIEMGTSNQDVMESQETEGEHQNSYEMSQDNKNAGHPESSCIETETNRHNVTECNEIESEQSTRKTEGLHEMKAEVTDQSVPQVIPKELVNINPQVVDQRVTQVLPERRTACRKQDDTQNQADPRSVVINEQMLLSETPQRYSPGTDLITNLTGLEQLRELGSSRFGAVRLLRRANSDGTFDLFAAKFYNAGDNREGRQPFEDLMKRLLKLSHSHVMPIVGVIPPTKVCGPILLTPYSEIGSLQTVLSAVRLSASPAIWNNATKLRVIVGLVSGLNYLHKNGIVHRELKPSDLILQADGSIRICGYATSIFDEQKYTKPTEVNCPSYMAPEVYDDEYDQKRTRDPKTDVFSLGLIMYELLCGSKVFSLTMSSSAIMRKALSERPRDRPLIPTSVHKILQEMISRCWVPAETKRPTMENLWDRMREVDFKLFPDVDVIVLPQTQ